MMHALILSFSISLLTAAPFAAVSPADDRGAGGSIPAPSADEGSGPRLSAATLRGLALRSIGPALMSGRIADVAIDPERPGTWYVAAGSGGVWKTTNAGTTWTPIFDGYGAYSIGCVTVDPTRRQTIWVGTGEAVGGRHVGYGDGVYRSLDGGRSFRNMGLRESEHIAKILVDPRDPRVVWVASQGPLWSPGGERGLYRSGDGGESWEAVLTKGPWTGVTDVAFDPRNPDVLYAATHQRHRTVWALVNGGPESGIHKSTDGGRTWRQLSSGLPGGDLGKIGLAVSPQRPDVLYATIELAGRTGGFWRSEDGGESWRKMSDVISGGTGPHYYQEIFCDPHRFDVVYQVDVRMRRTEDGGTTWETVESRWKHVDNHALAFSRSDPDFLLVGCDGGLYRSWDRGETFAYAGNLPLTQFYKLSLDREEPFYHVAGGTQDNATQYGPSRTLDVSGIRNADWRILIGGDGHDCAIDPECPDIIYCESQKGYLRRYDRRTGESVDIRPQPEKGEEDLRFNWDAPIHISPHSSSRIYHGSRKLHRSDDRGDSWRAISPDLSRGIDRLKLEHMERVWSIDAVYDNAAMSDYGNITSISESPLVEGLIYVGTDDGLIQVTEDGGGSWRRIERVFGVPEHAFVNDIKADLHDADTVYAVLDHHKTGDLRPYLIRSDDRGRTWRSIAGDLPERQILWRLAQDHVKSDLLFLGAEFGLWVTLDGGQRWIRLEGGVPTIPFRDIEIQPRECDLVGATFGRGFYVLDDYSPLRLLSEELLRERELVLFPVKRALLYEPTRLLGGEKGSQGDAYFTAPNPPYGAVFTYWLRDSLKTRRDDRREREARVKAAGGDNVYPGWDAIREEDREPAPELLFTITDARGDLVTRVSGATAAGLHRVSWDLRHPSIGTPGDRGPRVTPGRYTVRAARRVRGELTELGEPQSFEVVALSKPTLGPPDRPGNLAFQRSAGELQRSVRGAVARVTEALEQLSEIESALARRDAPGAGLLDETADLRTRLTEALDALRGDPTRSRRDEPGAPSIESRLRVAVRGASSSHGPTRTHRRQVEIAREEYAEVEPRVRRLIEEDLVRLHRKLEEAGVPWTPGRPIPRASR